MADNSRISNFRELCQRLKPILGNKIEQIYNAYFIEDDEGKKQIEAYLELLLTKHLPEPLEQTTSDLLPPTKEDAAGEYPIGTVQYAGKDLFPFGLREGEWIQHLAIFGRSGAGKTNIGFLILKELKHRNKPFLLFDWKRNYRDLLTLKEFKDVEVYTIGRDIAPFTFNPLIPPEGTAPKTWLKKLNEIIAHAYCLGNGVLYLLQQAVDTVYEQAGVYDNLVQRWPTFKDVLLQARNMDTRGREAGWLSSTLRALSTLCFGDMDKIVNSSSNRSIDHILDRPVILELDGLTQSDKTFFIEAVLLYLHHKRIAEGRRENFKHTIIIEEAHHILSDERRSLVGGQSVMDLIFREIREFGESLILLDQHPSKISVSALGNTHTTICLNLKHKTDINAMSQAMLLDKDKDILGMLEVGQGVVKLQSRIARPFLINIPHFAIEKGTISDSYIQNHMRYLTPASTETDFRLPQITSVANPQNTDDSVLAFLKDIQAYPDSGIAQRYKRLNISVRQGQKLKEIAIKSGFVNESTKITTNGRLKVLQLSTLGAKVIKEGFE